MSYLKATDLARAYPIGRKGLFGAQKRFFAVDGVSLALNKGETLGIVGESGCGKSTLSRLILGLIDADRGVVELDGQNLSQLDDAGWRGLRRKMQLVYQDAAGSLDPRMPVRAQVEEPLHIHGLSLKGAERALQAVGLAGAMANRYPHEMSGGQLQRVVIARALALEPEVIVLDEPVSALDVSIQAQIVNLLMDLQRDFGLTYIFVSHDLSVVQHMSTRVAVMYLGRIVEEAPRAALFAEPLHPYTRVLIDAVPKPDPAQRRAARLDVGDPPNPADPPTGCRFHPRCPLVMERCKTEVPALQAFPEITHGMKRDLPAAKSRRVACHLVEEIS